MRKHILYYLNQDTSESTVSNCAETTGVAKPSSAHWVAGHCRQCAHWPGSLQHTYETNHQVWRLEGQLLAWCMQRSGEVMKLELLSCYLPCRFPIATCSIPLLRRNWGFPKPISSTSSGCWGGRGGWVQVLLPHPGLGKPAGPRRPGQNLSQPDHPFLLLGPCTDWTQKHCSLLLYRVVCAWL
jgi:hypothetical protein